MSVAFEINLLGDRAASLRRRRMLHELCGIGAVALFAVGGLLAILAAMHLTTAMRMSLGVRRISQDLVGQQKICTELDALREAARKRAEPLKPLLPVARMRVAWTPKLVTLAKMLPPDMGIQHLSGNVGDLLGAATPARQTEGNLPHMSISVLRRSGSGFPEEPFAYVERLRASDVFMDKLEFIRLESAEQGSWQGQPAIILRSAARAKVAKP